MIAVHQNVYNLVQAKFSDSVVVKSIHLNVCLAQEHSINDHRILALVECDSSYALFVLISEYKEPQIFTDLSFERAFPIDHHFNCDTDPIPNNQTHIIFNVTYKKIVVHFKIQIGIESSKFASEVIKAKEYSSHNTNNHHWLQKYNVSRTYQETNMDDEFTDITVSRQKMAQGGISSNRESLLKYELSLKQAEYTNQRKFTIFVGTWNVNGKPPPVHPSGLRDWLEVDDEPPDIYAIGFQELDLSKEAFLFNETTREAEWQKAIEMSIHSKAKYRLVGLVRLVGIQLAVMINYSHYEHVSNVAVDYIGTGILGKMGNKGGVAVSFQLHNTTLCFVNSHLAAHVEEVERRNQDYNDISTKINFKRHPQSIKDHDQIYWLGDLNYRVMDLPATKVKSLIAVGDLNTILVRDQLNQQKEMGKILVGYEEGDITFQPTYKYDVDTDRYDSSEKARAPAWTDRIFYRGKGIFQQIYRSHMSLKISDHKPVSGLFRSEIGIIDRDKYRRIHEELLKSLDKLENEYLPQVAIDTTDVVFDMVKFREPQIKDIIIANTGMVPVDFRFIQKNDEKTYCKDWLRISPFSNRINPGEKCDIHLEVNLEQPLLRLDDILVLHLEGGKDLFITVSAECQRSSFTMSISTLCRCPVPILHLTPEQVKHAENGQSPILYSVPRELWLLVDYLYRNGLKTRDLFESSALHEELSQIRNWLDTGSLNSINGSVNAVAESLLLFLSYTKDPVVPFHLHKRCVEVCENFSLCREILDQFPSLERNVFLYVCMFLQELLKYNSNNGLEAHSLAVLFSEILMRTPIRSTPKAFCRKKTKFVEQFLTNDLSPLHIPNK